MMAQEFRIGHGFDAHRLHRGRKLVLGGVMIPHSKGLVGHSDADVLLHALINALLGALRLMRRKGYKLVNADVTLIARQPKLAPYYSSMRKKVAMHIKIPERPVNIKAATTEKLCWIGSITWRKLLPLTFFVFVSLSANAAEISPTVSKATAPPWEKLSDQQIARLFFPKGKLHFSLRIEELPMLDPALFDGVAVNKVKRVVANFDNDPDDEMAVLIDYSTGMCNSCIGNVIFAILDRQAGKVRIAWRTEKGEAFGKQVANISTMKIITKDRFVELACTYDSSSIGTGRSYKKMKIVRWDGKRFAEIWSYDLEGYDGGNHGTPHDYLANVEFIDDQKGAKRIKVASLYTTRFHREEQRMQYNLTEEFAWSEKAQMYQSIKQQEVRYENGQTCVSYSKGAAKEESNCYGETAYERGSEYLRQGNYKLAIQAFNEALKLNPRSAKVYVSRGDAYSRTKDDEKAIADYTAALKIDRKSADAYQARGFLYLQKDQYGKAIDDYSKALEIIPKSTDAYFHRAGAYMRGGQYDEAISDYTRAASIAPGDPWNYIFRGTVYYEKGDYDKAISDYSKALEMKPLPGWAYYARGLAYWKKGQYDFALTDLRGDVEDPTLGGEHYYYRGRVYMDKRDYERAIAEFDKVRRTSPKKAEVYLYTAQAYERLGLPKKAIVMYRALIQSSSSGTNPLTEHARERIADLEK